MKVLVVTAFYPTPENPASGSFIATQVQTLNQLGLDVEPFVVRGHSQKLAYPRALPRLRRRLAEGDVDVVHANYVFSGLLARLQRRAPLVVTFNGSDLLGPVVDAQGRHSAFSHVSVALSKAAARMADAVIVPSREMAERVAFAGDRVHVISHGMDMELFAPIDRAEARAQLEMDPERPYLLFAARPDNHVKNFPLAKAAVERLRPRHPDLELIVAHRETQQRLALLMSACDGLVFPSFQEGSPNVVKQAMACNLPVAASDVGDVRDVIGGTDGCYVCDMDPDAFADALDRILQVRRRTNGREAVRRFDRHAVARRVADLYAEVARGIAPGSAAG